MGKRGPKQKDVTGQRFGQLTVIKYIEIGERSSHWLCRCDCGNETTVALRNLGYTKSCGCYRIKIAKERNYIHGKSKDLEFRLWNTAKFRAKRSNITFKLTLEDIKIPEFCPVFGIRLEHAIGIRGDNSPSLDRFNANDGYIPGNIRVISWKANRLKSNMTVDDCRKLLCYMENR